MQLEETQTITWERHSQVILGGGLDANSNFNSISMGGSYDFLHKGDASEADTYDKRMDPLYDALDNIQNPAIKEIEDEKTAEISASINAEMTRAVSANSR
jgi:hypothetical protein